MESGFDLICIRMFLSFVALFLGFFCMLFNPPVASASMWAEPQPICPRLQSQLIAPFCLAIEIFFVFTLLFSGRFDSVLTENRKARLLFLQNPVWLSTQPPAPAELTGDALCTFKEKPLSWKCCRGDGVVCHSWRETKHFIGILVGWWCQTEKSWSI